MMPPSKKVKLSTNDSAGKTSYGKTASEVPQPTELTNAPPAWFGADGVTRYRPNSLASEGTSTPRSPRPNGRGRGGGRGRGRGGRGGGVGRGRPKSEKEEDAEKSPDLPPGKQILTEHELALVAAIKARQQELQKFFQTVGAHQLDALNLMAARNLGKLTRKAKAHKKVPEYEETVQLVNQKKDEACELILTEYEMKKQNALDTLASERELIEKRFKKHVEEAKKEHTKGAEGELILLGQSHRAANDDTRTETASEDNLPHYHPCPPVGHVRGYYSSRITDETSLRHQVTSFDDEIRRDVVDDDVVDSLTEAVQEKETRAKEEQDKRQTMNMEALSEEAAKQYEQIKGYLVPRAMRASEMGSYALSTLADVSEWMAQQHRQKQYLYVPLARGDRHLAKNFDYGLSGPGSRAQRMLPHHLSLPPPPLPPPPPPPPPTLQPPPSHQQFIFQPQQHFFPAPPLMQRAAPVQPQPIPITFVNQTIGGKKSGKAGQRMLLPKV